jgi:hypothetical protein
MKNEGTGNRVAARAIAFSEIVGCRTNAKNPAAHPSHFFLERPRRMGHPDFSDGENALKERQ